MLTQIRRDCTLDFQDMVPAALTRDKKKINEVEIEVSVAWKSTLYVTNFPENSDDASIRELFGKVSDCFLRSRWPLKSDAVPSLAVRADL
jgi:hypothetical protein